MPFSISLLLLLYGLLTKRAHRRRVALVSSLLILYLISNSYLINKAFYWWEYKPVNLSEITKTYGVGIVLTGGLAHHAEKNADHPTLGQHADRFLQGYLLYKQGKIKKIIITGTSPEAVINLGNGETQLAAKLLIQWGVRPEDIILEQKARNTRENALFTAKILKAQFPGEKYLLITSASHMRRSIGCFNKAGITADAFPADFYANEYITKIKDMLVPDPAAVGYSQILFKEWIGIIVYKIMGYC